MARLHLIESDIDAIVAALEGATERIFFASPFIGHVPGSLLADRVRRRQAEHPNLDARGLTSLTEEALTQGFSSARGIQALVEACEVRSITNLHAKLVVIDGWATVGSANLTEHGLDAGNLELGIQLTGSAADRVAARFCTWWDQYTSAASRIRTKDVRNKVSAEAPGRQPPTPMRGRSAKLERGDALRAHRAALDLHDALTMLRAGFVRDPNALRASNSPRMPSRRGPAYGKCVTLRTHRDIPEHEELARQILLDVLRLHRDRDARAHAAYRLAHDSPRPRDLSEIRRALRKAYRDDPALNVRRHAYRALRHLGLTRLTYPAA